MRSVMELDNWLSDQAITGPQVMTYAVTNHGYPEGPSQGPSLGPRQMYKVPLKHEKPMDYYQGPDSAGMTGPRVSLPGSAVAMNHGDVRPTYAQYPEWNMAQPPTEGWPTVKPESGHQSQQHYGAGYLDYPGSPGFYDPYSTSQTSDSPTNDEERTRRRREQNKMAAQRCRQRRRNHVDELVKELQALECDNTSLTYEIHQLRKERSHLEMTLGQHASSCQRRALHAPST